MLDLAWFTQFVLPWLIAVGAFAGWTFDRIRQARRDAFAEASHEIQRQLLDVSKKQLELATVIGSTNKRAGGGRTSKPAAASSDELELRRRQLELKAKELEEKRVRRQLKTAVGVWRWVERNL